MRAVNLLPREVKRNRTKPSAVGQLAIVSPFVVVGLIAAGFLLASSNVNDKKATLQDSRAALAALPAPKPTIQPNSQLAAQRDQRITALASALHGRLGWDRLLRDLSAVLPGDVWLTRLSGEKPADAPVPTTATTTATTTPATTTTQTTPPAPAVTGAPLSLQGYTYSQEGVARFLSRLGVIPELEQVKLVSSAHTELLGRTVYSFQIDAMVQPQVTG
jgi:Tfp pilus assembly protein PilN